MDGSRGSYDNTRVSESDSDYESSPEDGENDTDIENSCSLGESHTIIDASSSCCNHKIVLVHGLDLRKYWNECAKPLRKTGPRTNDLMEDHVNATVNFLYYQMNFLIIRNQSSMRFMISVEKSLQLYPVEEHW